VPSILHAANRIAEERCCFIEADFTAADDPDRSWGTPINNCPDDPGRTPLL
jgi:hypothetical protein